MWQERVKGLLVIALIGLLALGLVRYLTVHREELTKGTLTFSPGKIEKSILGVIRQIKQREEPGSSEEEVVQPVQIIEQKAGDLIEEIKKLPQEQAEIVKERVLKQMCGELMEEE